MTYKPTDEELENLFVEETGFDIDDFPAAIFGFARAVLAKWGTPAQAAEPVALLVRKNSWRAGQWEVAPPDSPTYGKAWADQREYVYTAPQPYPTPKADSQPTDYPPLPSTYYLVAGEIRGWDEHQMRAYVDSDRAARAPADSVTAPAGGAALLKEILAEACCEDSETYLTSDQCRKLYDLQRRIESIPTPPTHAADSVQEDAARLDWLEQNLFHREKDEWDTKFGGYADYNMWVLFSPKGIQGRARDIIDAARKQGEKQ